MPTWGVVLILLAGGVVVLLIATALLDTPTIRSWLQRTLGI